MSKKSEFPYLVDISITNECPYGCPWCYAAAAPSGTGQHAEYDWLTHYLCKLLFDARVFEVVFGGGEPTLWWAPYRSLSDVLEEYRKKSFKTSLTTRNYRWHASADFQKCCSNLSALAVSCQTLLDLEASAEMRKAAAAIVQDAGQDLQVTVQTILELHTPKSLKEFLEACSRAYVQQVMLLGFKRTGRGADFSPDIGKEWIDVAKDSGLQIGVDSSVVSKWSSALLLSGVASWRLGGEEGRQTCYVDAVSMKMYPSSTSSEGYCISRVDVSRFLDIFSAF